MRLTINSDEEEPKTSPLPFIIAVKQSLEKKQGTMTRVTKNYMICNRQGWFSFKYKFY